MSIAIVAHCDWSKEPRKRWMTVAILRERGWRLHAPELVGDTSTLFDRLQERAVADGAVLTGFDFPIGLPEAYARAAGIASFREALQLFGFGTWSDWYDVAAHRDQISLHRPFYPARPGGTARSHLLEALGMTDQSSLLRICERATPGYQDACILFWTLGGNQVGKGAIAGWQEIIIPRSSEIGLWPFDGRLADLANSYPVVVAETYPGAVYRQFGMPRHGWSKRRHSDRVRMGEYMMAWLAIRPDLDADLLLRDIEDGFGTDKAGEDRFDATVGLLGMLDVVDGRRSEGVPALPSVHKWEGWIIGHHREDLE